MNLNFLQSCCLFPLWDDSEEMLRNAESLNKDPHMIDLQPQDVLQGCRSLEHFVPADSMHDLPLL